MVLPWKTDATESINVWLMEGTGTRHLDGHQPKRTASVSAVDCASINACTIGNCLRLYCRWSYMMSICVDGPALEGFDATQSINVWLSDSELPSMHVTLTLLFEILTFLFGWGKNKCVRFAFITLQMPPFRPLQSRATTSYCWATRLISLVAHWATTFQSNLASPDHERKIIMRKRLKLVKSSKPTPLIKSHLVMLEKQLCDSHFDEKRFEENAAVTNIKDDLNYFFRYAKKFSICKTDIGPLMNHDTNFLSNDKHEMCRLLVDQFTSVSTIPDPQHIITDPVSFFTHEPNTGINKSLSLTDIMLNEDIIIEAVHELSPNSAAGPDCIPSSLLVNCATELAPVLLLIFFSLSFPWSYPKILEKSCYYSDLQVWR